MSIESGISSFDEHEESESLDPLEKYLLYFENIARRYHDTSSPFYVYDLDQEDVAEFTSSYYGLRYSLIQKSWEYREEMLKAPLYPKSIKGVMYKLIDNILHQEEFRISERSRMLDKRIIPNPYLEAKRFLESTMIELIEHKIIQPELIWLIVERIRKLDAISIENIRKYNLGI